jgi:hypothetical protein
MNNGSLISILNIVVLYEVSCLFVQLYVLLSNCISYCQAAISIQDSLEQAKRMQAGKFDFNDFLKQTQSVRTMGGISGFLKMMPGGA